MKLQFVGLDVHQDSIAIAAANEDGSPPETLATIPNDTKALVKQLNKLSQKATIRGCYEAGPTRFGLYHALRNLSIDCIVVAPSLVPKTAGDRVKTDRRDAVKLARFLRSGRSNRSVLARCVRPKRCAILSVHATTQRSRSE